MGDAVSSEKRGTGDVAVEAARQTMGDGATIGEPRKLAGGAMHDSWAVDATTTDGVRELVVRVSPAGRADFEKTRREFEVLRVAFARGVRCPEPIAVGECESGEDYLVMTRVHGDTNPRQLITGERFAKTRERLIEPARRRPRPDPSHPPGRCSRGPEHAGPRAG